MTTQRLGHMGDEGNFTRTLTSEESEILDRITRGDVLWEDMDIPLDEIQIDYDHYQRGVRPEHVSRIIREFNPLLLEPLLLNVRDNGTIYVMEGQHRLLALRELRSQGDPRVGDRVRSRVFVGLSLAEEALIFNMQDARRALTPIERFRAGLLSGSEPYVTINARTEACGWEVVRYPKDGQNTKIDAVNALIRLGTHFEGDMLERVLTTYREAWGTDRAPTHAIMMGMAQFIRWYDGEFNEKQFIVRLREIGRDALTHEADKRRVLDHIDPRSAIGMTLVNIYNYGRPSRTRLVAWETKALTAPKTTARRTIVRFGARSADVQPEARA